MINIEGPKPDRSLPLTVDEISFRRRGPSREMCGLISNPNYGLFPPVHIPASRRWPETGRGRR